MNGDEGFLCGTGCLRARPDRKKAFPEFINLLTQSPAAKRWLESNAVGQTMPNMNTEILSQLTFRVPPLGEQLQISELVSSWDTAIEKTERLVVAKKRLLNGLYQKLFGVSAHSRIGWRFYQLSEFLVPRSERAVPSDNLPLYSLTIENGVTPKTDRYDREFLVKNAGEKQYAVVYPGDIVFNPANLRWGAIARAKIMGRVVVSPIYEVLRIHEEKVNASLLANALTCPRQIAYFATKTEGTLIERMAVKLDVFLHTKIWLPETREGQDEIAALLDNIEIETLLHRRILDSLKSQKRGLMQKLLTGQWRVRVDSDEVTA